MPNPANARTHADDAPHGLDIVQELLNTRAAGTAGAPRPDLLRDGTAATAWAQAALAARRGHAQDLDDDDAAALRHLRDSIRNALVTQGDPAGAADERAQIELTLVPSGAVEWASASAGAGVNGLFLGEMMLAQTRGDWERLKLCALEPCGAAFYDHSRNVSARYHSAWCANHVNQRNSRARRRAAST